MILGEVCLMCFITVIADISGLIWAYIYKECIEPICYSPIVF